MKPIIDIPRSLIPACDCDFETYTRIVMAAEKAEKVKAVKVGIALALGTTTLQAVVGLAHDYGLKVIYDHQKAGTDIHESTPRVFMDRMVEAGVDAIILFPLSGPVVQYEWTRAALARDLGVIIGGEMTHPRFLANNTDDGKKEGQNYREILQGYALENVPGYIRADAPRDIFRLACKMGVTDFVVPGNKPDRIRYFYDLVTGMNMDIVPTFYSPGLVDQGGGVKEGGEAAGDRWHAIAGRAVKDAEDILAAMEVLTSQL